MTGKGYNGKFDVEGEVLLRLQLDSVNKCEVVIMSMCWPFDPTNQ